MQRQYEQQRRWQQQPVQPVDYRESFTQNANAERAQLHQELNRQPGTKHEKIGGMNVIRDGSGNIRDMQYGQGSDARYRMYGYDNNGQLNHMVVDSKSKGGQVWDRVAPNTWVERNSNSTFQGEMMVDQKTGEFSYRGRDGVTHTYDGKQFRQFSGMEQGQYDKQVNDLYAKDHQITDKASYKDNLYRAAESKKPVVMTFGRSSDPECQKHLEALAEAKKNSNGAADFQFIDLDKVDPNSKHGEYAKYIQNDYGTPLTMVFTQHQGKPEAPVVPDRPMHWQKGNLDANALVNGVNEAAKIQAERTIDTGREKPKPPEQETEKPKPKPKPEDVIAESSKPIKDQRSEDLFKGLSRDERFALIQDTLAKVDALKNPKASAQVRATIALGVFGLGNESAAKGKADEAKEFFLEGSEYVMSAGIFNKDIYQYPSFAQKLHDALPGNAGDALIEKGRENPKWMYPDPAKVEAAKSKEEKAQVYMERREAYRTFITEQMKLAKKKAA